MKRDSASCMPNAELILAGLSEIAREYWEVAVLWHVIIAIAVLAAFRGWRPSNRVSAFFLIAPLASVALFASLTGSWFNGAIFFLLTVALATIGLRLSANSVQRSRTWAPVAGALMIAFAWIYPHFLPQALVFAQLYAAPVGLLPCPTLALVIGFTLVVGAFDSRPWTLVLVAAGLFYGLFGTLRLGVAMDVGLIAGALALAATLRVRRSVQPGSRLARPAA